MNRNQLRKLGVPQDCINICLTTFRDGCMTKAIKKNAAKGDIVSILANPLSYTTDHVWGDFAKALLAEAEASKGDSEHEAAPFKIWGRDMIEQGAIDQMATCCRIPGVIAGAMMPDSHWGYSVNIGGVLATDNIVLPTAVGFDISCSMKMTVIDKTPDTINTEFERYRLAIERATLFGAGKQWKNRKHHPVLDAEDWNAFKMLGGLKDKAWEQLGTSGSSNHFSNICDLDVPNEAAAKIIGVPQPGKYVAILTHSGSRNPGKTVCEYFNKIAKDQLPGRYAQEFKDLAWLSLNSEAGQQYWIAMQLMAQYALANHEVIHRDLVKELNTQAIASVANSHNLAYKEKYQGKDVIVHRKGATPAQRGALAIIPGSMGDACFVVGGLGNEDSINSASHGAGRAMSRREAKAKFNWAYWKEELKRRNVVLLHGGLDEVPGSYKSIQEVMKAQSDLVEIVARLDPRIVEMDSGNTEQGD